MPARSWKLTDVAAGVYLPTLDLGPSELNAKGSSLRKRTLRGGPSEGVDEIRVDNGTFAFTVLPTRGLGIWKAWRGNLEIGWRSPVRGPVHPALVPVMEPSGIGWLDGFDEWLCRCGLESNGAPDFDQETGRLTYPLHGRIANKPAHEVEVSVADDGEITVRGVVDETRFHFAKLRLTTTLKTRPGEPGLRIYDEVENLSASPAGMQLLYHINFGQPLLDAGSRFIAPVKTVVPRNENAAAGLAGWNNYPAEQPGVPEQVYLLELAGDAAGRTRTLLKQAHGRAGASLEFSLKQLPCFTVWKNPTAGKDGYVTGLEPGTNYPNPRSHEKGQKRVVELPPGGKQAFELKIEIHATGAEVAAAEKGVAALAAGLTPKVFDTPQSGWCFGIEE